jgi:hypothetical protein
MVAKCETAGKRGVEAHVHQNMLIPAFYRQKIRERGGKIWRESGGGREGKYGGKAMAGKERRRSIIRTNLN